MQPETLRTAAAVFACVAVLFTTGSVRTLYTLLRPLVFPAPGDTSFAVDTNPAVRSLYEGSAGQPLRSASIGGVPPGPTASARRVFSATELAQYTGGPGEAGIYLAVMGQVFDVEKGRKHYGPGGSYSGFVGRDASVAFHTGNTDEQPEPPSSTGAASDPEPLTNVLRLSRPELAGIAHWTQFYQRQYTHVGYLHGRFYDAAGQPTEYLDRVHSELHRHRLDTEKRERWQTELPACNVEWTAERGTRVWCSAHSGGVRRDWRGVPRKFYEPGQTLWRCACVRPEQQHLSYLEAYAGCEAAASSCEYDAEQEQQRTLGSGAEQATGEVQK